MTVAQERSVIATQGCVLMMKKGVERKDARIPVKSALPAITLLHVNT